MTALPPGCSVETVTWGDVRAGDWVAVDCAGDVRWGAVVEFTADAVGGVWDVEAHGPEYRRGWEPVQRLIPHAADSRVQIPRLPHEWDDGDDPRSCLVCACTYLDSGHHDRENEECHARLRGELDSQRNPSARVQDALASELSTARARIKELEARCSALVEDMQKATAAIDAVIARGLK